MNRRELIKMTGVLLGTGFSGSLALRVMAGEVPEATTTRSLFNRETRQMIATLSEMIIPKTDTPGAVEAGVPAFIEMMVSDWCRPGEQKIFFDGLSDLNRFCTERYGKRFNSCEEQHQIDALKEAEASARKYVKPQVTSFSQKYVDEKTPFFTKIKELTVYGYFTSEVGATKELSYNPMPMRYDGDYEFSEVGHQWSW